MISTCFSILTQHYPLIDHISSFLSFRDSGTQNRDSETQNRNTETETLNLVNSVFDLFNTPSQATTASSIRASTRTIPIASLSTISSTHVPNEDIEPDIDPSTEEEKEQEKEENEDEEDDEGIEKTTVPTEYPFLPNFKPLKVSFGDGKSIKFTEACASMHALLETLQQGSETADPMPTLTMDDLVKSFKEQASHALTENSIIIEISTDLQIVFHIIYEMLAKADKSFKNAGSILRICNSKNRRRFSSPLSDEVIAHINNLLHEWVLQLINNDIVDKNSVQGQTLSTIEMVFGQVLVYDSNDNYDALITHMKKLVLNAKKTHRPNLEALLKKCLQKLIEGRKHDGSIGPHSDMKLGSEVVGSGKFFHSKHENMTHPGGLSLAPANLQTLATELQAALKASIERIRGIVEATGDEALDLFGLIKPLDVDFNDHPADAPSPDLGISSILLPLSSSSSTLSGGLAVDSSGAGQGETTDKFAPSSTSIFSSSGLSSATSGSGQGSSSSSVPKTVHHFGIGTDKRYEFHSITTDSNEGLFVTREGLGAYPVYLTLFERIVAVLFTHWTDPLLGSWRRYAHQIRVKYAKRGSKSSTH